MTDLISTLQRTARRLFKTHLLPSEWHQMPIGHLPLLAVDLELTSLERDADIVSFGWVSAEQQKIQLGTARHAVVKTEADLQQSPTIHGITNQDIVQGNELEPILRKLLSFTNTHIWVFHNALLDTNALKNACQKLDIEFPEFTFIDTLQLERYLLLKRQHPIGPKDLSLVNCRKRYGLGEINAHNALSDAMATMELVLIQLSQFSPTGSEPLNHLIRSEAISIS